MISPTFVKGSGGSVNSSSILSSPLAIGLPLNNTRSDLKYFPEESDELLPVVRVLAPMKDKVSKMIRATSSISTFHLIIQELIMNSIDSGASTIDITIGSEESLSVNVTDNGSGIPVDNFKSLGLWHFSSKSPDEKTLGFRGEALASIASFSRVTISSKTRISESLFSMDLNSRKIVLSPSKFVHNSGTSIHVDGIFENVPVRRGIVNMNNEVQKIKYFIHNMSLLRHNISWSIRKQNVRRTILSIKPQVSVAGRIIEQFGQDIMSKMINISISIQGFHIKGFLSPLISENCHWNKSYQSLFLNGRWLNNNDIISSAFNYIYNSLLSTHKSGGPAAKHFNPSSSQIKYCPAFVLQVECSSESYDILSEPDKTYPLFQNIHIIKELIHHTIRTASAASNISESRIRQFMENFNLSSQGRHSNSKYPLQDEENATSEINSCNNQHNTLLSHEMDSNSCLADNPSSLGKTSNYTIIENPSLSCKTISQTELFDYAFAFREDYENENSNLFDSVVDYNENSGLGKRYRMNEDYFNENESHLTSSWNDSTGGSPDGSKIAVKVSRDTTLTRKIDSIIADENEIDDCISGYLSDSSNFVVCSKRSVCDDIKNGDIDMPQCSQYSAIDNFVEIPCKNVADKLYLDSKKEDSLFCLVNKVAPSATSVAPPLIRPLPAKNEDCDMGINAFSQPSRLYKFDNKISKAHLQAAQFISQVDSKYILMVTSDGNIIAMDQHAASERIGYENFDIDMQSKISTTKNVHYIISLNRNEAEFAEKKSNTLKFWGFEFEILWNPVRGPDNSTVNVRVFQVADIHGEALTADDFKECIITLMSKGDFCSDALQKPPAFHRIIASKSCKTAVKFGDRLSSDECIELIANLSRTSLPFQCAHGRPSIAPLIKLRKSTVRPALHFDNVLNSLRSIT